MCFVAICAAKYFRTLFSQQKKDSGQRFGKYRHACKPHDALWRVRRGHGKIKKCGLHFYDSLNAPAWASGLAVGMPCMQGSLVARQGSLVARQPLGAPRASRPYARPGIFASAVGRHSSTERLPVQLFASELCQLAGPTECLGTALARVFRVARRQMLSPRMLRGQRERIAEHLRRRLRDAAHPRANQRFVSNSLLVQCAISCGKIMIVIDAWLRRNHLHPLGRHTS